MKSHFEYSRFYSPPSLLYPVFMRIFLAITPPEEVKARFAEAVQRLTPFGTDIVWCKRDQFHLTLAYLGEVSPAILPHATAAAERVCSTLPAFDCRAYGFGFFGNKRNPKTFWASIEPTPELDALHEGLWRAFSRFGFKDAEEEFRPHITLGRGREASRNAALLEAMDADEAIDFGAWSVSRITFYESKPAPHGPVHRILAQIGLAGG